MNFSEWFPGISKYVVIYWKLGTDDMIWKASGVSHDVTNGSVSNAGLGEIGVHSDIFNSYRVVQSICSSNNRTRGNIKRYFCNCKGTGFLSLINFDRRHRHYLKTRIHKYFAMFADGNRTKPYSRRCSRQVLQMRGKLL